MAEDLEETSEGQENYEDTDNTDMADSQDTQESTQDDGRVSIQGEGQEQKPPSLKDIFHQEYNNRAAAPDKARPFEGMDDYFAKNEVATIKQLPLNVQNTVASMLERMTSVNEQRIASMQEKAELGETITKAADGLEEYITSKEVRRCWRLHGNI